MRLTRLELAALTTPSQPDGTVHITLEVAEESIRRPTVKADESTQYDVLSAFHKSVRGSSDAALFWFLYAVEKLGMDPMTFLRRLIVACSEDIGLANPQAMVQAVTAMDAYHKIGWPEAKYNIAQAILFAVESPKSNAIAVAIGSVMKAIERDRIGAKCRCICGMPITAARRSSVMSATNIRTITPAIMSNRIICRTNRQIRTFYKATEQGMEDKIRQNQERRGNKINSSRICINE